jgi:hypothetical protein
MNVETLSRHNLVIRVFVLADALEAVVITINKEAQELHIPLGIFSETCRIVVVGHTSLGMFSK